MRKQIARIFVLAIAILSIALYTNAQADPSLPLPRMPIGGDQDDPNDPPRLNDPAFVHVPEVQLFTVPGKGNFDLTFDFVFRAAAMDSEFGFFRVDSPCGAIDGLSPGAAGYLSAALERAIVIFESGSDASAPDVTVSLSGGDHLAFFIVQDSTLSSLLANNPQNLSNRGPRAFFSLDVLNPDNSDHFIGFRNQSAAISQFGFEDMDGGGDQDFDDIVYNINAYMQPLPQPTARDIVFVRGLDSQGDCTQANQWIGDYLLSPTFQQVFGNVSIGSLLHFNYRGGGFYTCPTPALTYTANDTCDGIKVAANELWAAIDAQAGGKVSIVAHGTGGIVAAYLVASQPDWARQHIANVVTFDSPLVGVAHPPSWAAALGSVCTTAGAGVSGAATLAEVQDGSDVMLTARMAATVVPFYTLDATAEDAPGFESAPRARARLSSSRPFSSSMLCGADGAPEAPLCEPPLPINDHHVGIWEDRFDGDGLDKAYLAACAVLNRTDCNSSIVTVPPGNRIITSTVTIQPGILRIRFTATFSTEVRMRLIAPDGIVYGPDGAGPIAGYALSDSTEIYEIANPAPGEWQVEFTSLASPIDGSEIVLSISILEVAEPKFTQAPVAILSGDVEGYAWQEIMLSGAESFDYDGIIVKYEWDVDDDGVFDYTTAAPQVSHRYQSAYSGKILLRVTDNEGLSSQDTASATIRPPRLFLPTIWN